MTDEPASTPTQPPASPGPTKLSWRHRLDLLRAIVAAASQFVTLTGILDSKRVPRVVRWGYRLLVVGVLFIPTWPGETIPYFVATIAILAAWLIATPQLMNEVERMDFSVFVPHFMALVDKNIVPVLRRLGREFRLSPAELDQLASFRPVFARHGPTSVLIPVLAQTAYGSAFTLIIAVIGIMIGPIAQQHHIGFWSPVSIFYALTFPYLVTTATVAFGFVMLRGMVATMKADAALDMAIGPPPVFLQETTDPVRPETPPAPVPPEDPSP